ncbi:unnamed protein product [Rotaria sordida]|uniref:Uncharacterized protein n=1 Tax=Rotaria sordida TaxID=392033 RepID=A0A816DUR7_9BILA|nr:unnamed protein product [Rotaria sordida]CAF1451305.1 unnamed protein product [Rotaria sordida]CAF1502043.1 unnamed protein product [Rotaria sordida]CAF1639081.1 unnamed protein product [Rotaria sordida]
MDVQLAEKVFHFLIKILSIFPCVIEDTTPPIPPTSKITFLPLPASPGQLKKRFESINDSNFTITSTITSTDEDNKKVNRTSLGAFENNPSMMKLFHLIRLSYQTH